MLWKTLTLSMTAILVTGSGQDLSLSDLDQYRSGTAFPSKIAPRKSSSKTAKSMVGCFQSMPGMDVVLRIVLNK